MKLTSIDQQYVTDVMKGLEGLVVYLANLYRNDDNVMMSTDDIIAELHEEILKGLGYYAGNNYPLKDMINIIKRMCYNRISELRYRYYVTYRRHEKTSVSLEVKIALDVATDEGNPEKLFDSSQRVVKVFESLESEAAKLIFKKIIIEKDFQSSNKEVTVYNRMRIEDIASIVGITLQDAAAGIREIKTIYAEVMSDDNFG
ncbi:MAG: hypothetical protein WC479_00500 [Candidatus Izemoplasmatales bacterium]|jgi:hypothetical protein